jgi:tetratricopeptide (TPR) repeat protein
LLLPGALLAGTPAPEKSPELAVRELFLSARMAEADGRLRQAVTDFRSAIERSPKDPVLRLEFAMLLQQLNVLDESRSQARKATELDPDFGSAWNLLGAIDLAEAEKNPTRAADAARELGEAHRLSPQNAGLTLAYARALLLNDAPDRAAGVLDDLDSESGDPRLLKVRAQADDRRGADAAAAAAYEKWLSESPNDQEAVASAIEFYESRQNWIRALELLAELEKAGPDNPAVSDRIALDLLRSGDFAQAEKKAREIARSRPEDRAARRTLASALYQLQRTDEARKILRQLIDQDPDDPTPVFTLAFQLAADGQGDDAVAVLRQLARRTAGNASRSDLNRGLQGEIAAIEYRNKRLDAARQTAESVAVEKGSVEERALDVLLQMARDEDKPDRGLEWAGKAAAAEPDSAEYRADRAEFEIRAGNKAEGANTLRGLAASGIASDAAAAIDAWMRLKDFPAAVAAAQEAAGRFDGNADLQFRLGSALERAGRVPEAAAAFRRALALRPDDPQTLNYLGYMFADRGENLEEARRLIQKAVALDPRNGAYLDSLGWVHFRLDEIPEARRYLTEAAARIPDDATIQEHLGDLEARAGQNQQALAHWKKSLTLSPDEPAKIEKKIRELAGRP